MIGAGRDGQSRFEQRFTSAATGWTFAAARAIADLDADGTPDIISADEVSPGGSRYRLDLQLAPGHEQTFSFVSLRGAPRVITVDIDHDLDLDLVVAPTLSRELVKVWLNNGNGELQESPVRPAAPLTTHSVHGAVRNGFPFGLPSTTGQPRPQIAPPPGPPALGWLQSAVVALATASDSRWIISVAGLGPRAPPALL